MATYKKRGHKPKVKPVKELIDELEGAEDSTTAEVFATLDEGANKAEEWVEKNQKTILTVVVGILVLALLYLGYTRLIAEPNEREALNELSAAQESFTTAIETTNLSVKDSLYTVALEGKNGKYGLLEIASNYKGTKAGNLANYYSGMSYLATKDYSKAISYLQDFSADDMMLAPLAKGAIGDAFMQLGQPEDALGEYEKAIKLSANDFTAPRFLFKAGIIAIDTGDYSKAVKYLTRVKEEFSDSEYKNQVDLYLGKAQAAK